MKRHLAWMRTLFIVLITVSLLATCLALSWINFLHSPIVVDRPVRYIYLPATSLPKLANDLNKKINLAHPFMFVLYTDLTGNRRKLQSGEYIFPAGSTPRQVLQQLKTGDVAHHQITFIEGWTLKQDLAALSRNPDIKHTLKQASPALIAKYLAIPEKNPEGWFYPDTYYFSHNATDLSILRRAYGKMQYHLNQQWQIREAGLPYSSPYQALIVASLIQREALYFDEMPLISGVIVNRLRRNMPLQVDASVIYAMGKPIKFVTFKDLRVHSPYNTYRVHGLPPTPIAAPGLPAVEAAMHPADTEYLYYVAKPDGHHVFSNTLKEHDQAIHWIREGH